MMRRFLIDSNILIDAIARREPFDEPARLLLALGRVGEFELWMSSSQLTDVFYVLSEGGKASRASWAKETLAKLREAVHVCSLGEQEFDSALASTWDDVEDACVYEAALKVQADVLVARNKKDFERSSIRVLDCEEAFETIEREDGVSYAEISIESVTETRKPNSSNSFGFAKNDGKTVDWDKSDAIDDEVANEFGTE